MEADVDSQIGYVGICVHSTSEGGSSSGSDVDCYVIALKLKDYVFSLRRLQKSPYRRYRRTRRTFLP
jgi:hypothetical protein